MDAGIIAAIKRRYRKRQISRALDFLSSNTVDMYKVDQRTAMKWMREIWVELDSTIVENCWRKTGIIGNACNGEAAANDELSELTERENNDVAELLNEVLPPRHSVSLTDVLNPVNEDECISEWTEEALVDEIVHEMVQNDQIEQTDGPSYEESEDVVDQIQEMAAKEDLYHLGMVIRILDKYNAWPASVRRAITSTQHDIRKSHQASLQQSRISDFFK